MNGIIAINKESGFTSFDVVAIMRRLCGTKKIGHGGTLDPMATGVLPIFIGSATKAVDFCPDTDKAYIAGFKLGITTDTQDTTGTVIAEKTVNVSREALEQATLDFIGEIEQLPPMYSAVQVNGKRLYELARKGIEVEREARKISVYSLEITAFDGACGTMEIHCSQGTYIRTLINDIGDKLSTGGAMTSLIRTKSGAFTLGDSISLDEAKKLAEQEKLADRIIPVERLYEKLPRLNLDEKQSKMFKNGVQLDGARLGLTAEATGLFAVYGNGGFLGLTEPDGELSMKIVRQFGTDKVK